MGICPFPKEYPKIDALNAEVLNFQLLKSNVSKKV